MVYIGKICVIIAIKLGVLSWTAERTSVQPFELDVVSTNGGKQKTESIVKAFSDWEGLFLRLYLFLL